MKNAKIVTVVIAIANLFTFAFSKEYASIDGLGSVTTKTLQVDDFTGINIEGLEDVYICYGTEQTDTVTGHPNIISRIKTDVSNSTWNIEWIDGK